MKIHHIGVASKDISKSIEHLKKLYDVASISEVLFDECQDASVCFVETDNGVNIELVSGRQTKGLLKRGVRYYHLCYLTSNIHKEIKRLQDNGAILLSEPKPAKLFNNRLVGFLNTNDGIIELLEVQDE